MKRFHGFGAVAVASLMVAVALPSQDAVAQAKSARELLVGSWTLVSADNVRADGSKVPVFGPDTRGTMIFTPDGRFALVQMRADLPRIAANSRDQATPEEYKAIVSGSIAYYGSYSVNEADGRTIELKLEGSTYANLLSGEQRRIVDRLTADELTFTNPRNPAGNTLEVAWKRIR